jgi:curved DNA-binding protein CbpA
VAVKNAYETLQVFPSAGLQEVKDAFRFALFRYHPDHNKGREEWAVQRTMELVDAYHILSDPPRRAHHDVMRAARLKEERGKKKLALFGLSDKAKLAEEEFQRGVEAWRADEYEAALKRFARVLEVEPDCANAKFNLGLCFLALEKFPESSNWLHDYISSRKEDADAKVFYGKVIGLQHHKPAKPPG